MKTLFSRRVVVAVCLLLLVLFLARPGADRLRGRVSKSISQALGRRVEVGSVHLRFLPRPGFEFENLIIHDDPSFSAEPLLRAPDVTAWLRVLPLLRGRIEIASLSLDQASLNLTRNAQGKWNLEDLLERTARISIAPTAAEKMESRPAFPYIEASAARINFKIGTEKTHFAFTDARFGLWQESENAWGMRLKAQPIRTDAYLTDTGVISVSGMWQRSPVLHQTPLQFSLEWKQAQIGQASKLVYGNDQGWRGNIVLTGTLAGTPEKLRVSADASIDDFRRFNVLGGGNLQLVAHCAANYNSLQREFSNVDCNAPAGDGGLELKGSASGVPFSSYDFHLVSTKVPAQAALSLVRHSKPGIPDDIDAAGSLSANLELSRGDLSRQPQLRGDGEVQGLRISSRSSSSQLALGTVPLALVSGATDVRSVKGHVTKNDASVSEARIEIGPVTVVLGRPVAVRARASLSLSSYQATVRGDAGVKPLLEAARLFHVPAPTVSADGSATVDLAIAGTWAGPRPRVLGTAQLRSVQAQVRGLNAPLEIVSANLILDQDWVRVPAFSASAAQANWKGALQIARPCVSPGACKLTFNLHASELNAADLNELLNPSAGKQSWYKFLAPASSPAPYLLQASATGKVAVDRLVIGESDCTHLIADVELHDGKLKLADLRAEALGGQTSGDWQADFSARPPAYSGTGSFDDVPLNQVADLMHNAWIDGSGTATYQFKASGWALQDLRNTADLSADFVVRDSSFPHIALPSQSSMLHASNFSGKIQLLEGQFSFPDAKLENANGVYKVSGTVSLSGGVNLKMSGESAPSFALSGTLFKTRVSVIPVTAAQAALKP